MTSSQAGPALSSPSFGGLGRRLGAYLLDALIAGAALFIVGFTLRAFRAVGLWTPAEHDIDPETIWRSLEIPAKVAVVFGFILSTGPIYLTLFEASPWQASIGKRILDMHVTDNEGKRISIARAFGRWSCKCFVNFFWLWPVTLGTISGTKDKKALHDYAAGTLVVRGRPKPGGSLEPWRVLVAFGIPFVWLLGMFLVTL